jgi:membrane protein DedA with SNARE-associated domain
VVEPDPLPIDRKGIALFAIPMALLTIAAWVGDAMAPTLLTDAPLLLLGLNARLRNLILVAPEVSALPFIVIAVTRLFITDPLFFLFGRRYGDVAIRWMERRLGAGASIVLWLEKGFRRAAYPMIVLLPNQWICLLAGATPMRWWVFAALNLGGTIVRVVGVKMLGDAFSDPILSVNDWIGDHRWQLTVVTFALVGIAVWRSMNKGIPPLETPSELGEELAEAAAEESEPGERPD